jgi:hypothetical protein
MEALSVDEEYRIDLDGHSPLSFIFFIAMVYDSSPIEVSPGGGGSVGTPSPAPAHGTSDSGTRPEDYLRQTNAFFFMCL